MSSEAAGNLQAAEWGKVQCRADRRVGCMGILRALVSPSGASEARTAALFHL